MKKLLFTFGMGVFILVCQTQALRAEFSGRLNSWLLFETDDFSSTTVAEVYDTSTDPDTLIGVVVGPDIETECNLPDRTCVLRKLGAVESETVLERVIDDDGTTVARERQEFDRFSLLGNLGINAKGSSGAWSAKVHGNLTSSLADKRALLGGDRFRYRFYDLYTQYDSQESKNWRATLGRKAVIAGVVVDGVTMDYFFGPESAKDSKTIGFFAGLAPDPITKVPSKDFVTAGPTFQFIPEFASQGETKFLFRSSIVFELYKMDFNRFYLFTQSQFTPTKKVSFYHYSTLDFPGVGDEDSGLKSSHFSLQSYWHPTPQWDFSLGFTQLRIDRNLQNEAVRWVTDNGTQSARVSDNLDTSHRYRIDVRMAHKPIPTLQPFIKARYERRTFDSDTILNNDGVSDPSLLDGKDAYAGTLGLRTFFLRQLETETSYGYFDRFRSSGHQIYQFVSWDSLSSWILDGYAEIVFSDRDINRSDSTANTPQDTFDYYLGTGASYRILTDLLGQIRYDFANEEDAFLESKTTIHRVLLRLDYKF